MYHDTRQKESSICLIANDKSGKGKASEQVSQLEEWLKRQPGKTRFERVSKGSDIQDIAQRVAAGPFDTVVVAGGDGTISTVAGALAGTDKVMGVIPSGTFNYFSRSLDIPDELEDALRLIEVGRSKAVNVGTINDRVFLNNASLGAYPAILDQREDVYRRWGRSRIAAHWSVIKALLTVNKPQSMRVTVDGTVYRMKTPLAFAANSAYQLEEFRLEGADAVRNGQFALYLAKDCGRFEMVKFAFKLARRTLQADRDFTLICGEEILIETLQAHRLVARDGEKERMLSPFRLRVLHDALNVIVP